MLDCMATCRGTDKKPCGNRSEGTTVTMLPKHNFKAVSGGDIINGILSTNETSINAIISSTRKRVSKNSISSITGNILPLCQVTGTE